MILATRFRFVKRVFVTLAHVSEDNGSQHEVDLVEVDAFAESAHEGQTRHSGEPYITHPRAVRRILEEELPEDVDDTTLAIALLHDVLEDCEVHPTVLLDRFGAPVQEGVTLLSWSIRALDIARSPEVYWSGLRRGPRAVRLVKGADRVHNVREALDSEHERLSRKYLRETPEILLPILEAAGESWLSERLRELVAELERAVG